MRDWNVRILVFTESIHSSQFTIDKFQIVRTGSDFTERDVKFLRLNDGLEFLTGVDGIRELCIFQRGESLTLNSSAEIRRGIIEGFHSMEEEKYWLAHEMFEDYWKHFEGRPSKFFHGVVLLCVAMVHHQMHHESNAARIFKNARDELEEFLSSAVNWTFSYPLSGSILDKVRDCSFEIIRT